MIHTHRDEARLGLDSNCILESIEFDAIGDVFRTRKRRLGRDGDCQRQQACGGKPRTNAHAAI